MKEYQSRILEVCQGNGATKADICIATGIKMSSINHYIRLLRFSGHLDMIRTSRTKPAIFVTQNLQGEPYHVDTVVKMSHRLRYMAHDPFGKTKRFYEDQSTPN
jgi:hypothetical protein